ncbi:WecB/TagA/CpsF family glycosyltransferase [Azospirillum sp.]|uniref:WecB/TagA/CpsF family glycosyltransferase n=1 Tax=Azospirillum sp. TaxID=34012 RepID=UPI002D2CC7C0|nr:WecB/TagA/CpsF family glycosyltransferase [Azospirillum sp.]HYD64823.1 WecB/TagA/CpsF family glycosyltransferase [Azospirillum sp.]
MDGLSGVNRSAGDFLDARGVRARRIDFLGVPLDPLDMEETVAVIDSALAQRVRLQHVVVNVSKLISMRRDADLHRDVVESDLINIDGMGIVWGARLMGLPVPARVAGIDLMDRVLELCARRGYRPYILGAKPAVLEQAIANIRRRYPDIDIAGWRDGYFKREEEEEVVDAIRASRADCLFVAMSSPMKERFTQLYRDRLGVSFLMGVGGSIDVMAGITRRAPDWMQRAGLEWLYRVLQEPRRMWRRYLVTNSLYLGLLTREVLRTRLAGERRA